MNEVFTYAAFGQLFSLISERPCWAACSLVCTVTGNKQPPKPSAPYSIFDKAELENRAVRVLPPFLTWVGRS
jgi:hypothetical protein